MASPDESVHRGSYRKATRCIVSSIWDAYGMARNNGNHLKIRELRRAVFTVLVQIKVSVEYLVGINSTVRRMMREIIRASKVIPNERDSGSRFPGNNLRLSPNLVAG